MAGAEQRRWFVGVVALLGLAAVVTLVALLAQLARDATDRSAPATPPPSALGNASDASLPGGITQLVVAAPHLDGYDRDLFGDWDDVDHDCQNTRAEVLIAESQVPVTFTTASSCTVTTGRWLDPWSGEVNTSAAVVDVDHTVALANAWRSGAWAWTPDQRAAYANDVADDAHLIAIPAGENHSKGDAGPEAWRPPAPSSWCAYARAWTAIKAKWRLTATPAEWSAILEMAATC
jgi:uncharacterized protein DUF1524